MEKQICFIHLETTHFHEEHDSKNIFQQDELNKKKLYCFNRLVLLKYEIGVYKNKKFIINKSLSNIIKPRCMYINEYSIKRHNITQDEANIKGIDIVEVINQITLDLSNVDIIIGFNTIDNLKVLVAEAIRYNLFLDFSNYVIIDINNFYHQYNNLDLLELLKMFFPKSLESDKLTIIKLLFFNLYSKFKNSLK